MSDELAAVLRLVAEGRLTPDEAAPIIHALRGAGRGSAPPATGATQARGSDSRGRRIRIRVADAGRTVVDVRVPLAFAALAARSIPGIPQEYASLIQDAMDNDLVGSIVDAEDEDGDGVRITVE